MLKNRKILYICLFFIFFLILSSGCSFAFSSKDENDYGYYYSTFPSEVFEKVKLLDEWGRENWSCFGFRCNYKNGSNYRVVFFDNSVKDASAYVHSSWDSGKYDAVHLSNPQSKEMFIYDYDSNYNFIESSTSTLKEYSERNVTHEYLFRYINAYDDDKLFFQSTPLTIVAQAVEKVEMKATIQEIIMIIPLILVVVVSFLGLHKALRMLSMLLHRCLII